MKCDVFAILIRFAYLNPLIDCSVFIFVSNQIELYGTIIHVSNIISNEILQKQGIIVFPCGLAKLFVIFCERRIIGSIWRSVVVPMNC